MTAEPTPGPWKRAELTVYALNGKGTNRFTAYVQGGFLEDTRTRTLVTPLDELEANARLIAAAPDLFAALHKALDVIFAMGLPDEVTDNVMAEGRAALAKAKGRYP